MINFDEFDIEENSTDIYGFLSREGIKIIKTCGKKNISTIIDAFNIFGIGWIDKPLTEREITRYKYIVISNSNVVRYITSNRSYLSRNYPEYYYYDMCDGNVHKMKQKK